MDDQTRPSGPPDPTRDGPLSRAEALALLERGDELLASADFADAARHFARVIGFDDPAVTAAALLGLGEARYRVDDDAGAIADWEAVLELPENPSTYAALRNVAAARVRNGDLPGALEAYRAADRRAPLEDKAEIVMRLGWLAKETGDTRGSRRYFARGRGDGPLLPLSKIIVAVTVVISLAAIVSVEGDVLYEALWLDKFAVADGEYWRLWSVTLLHGDYLHLAFNMYALWLVGPIVERWYGQVRFVIFYLVCAAAGSTASFAFGGDIPAVGASGAIFGLIGMIFAGGRLHHPVDRQGMALVSRLGVLILINIALGFAYAGRIDNAAHIGGLLIGAWLGALILPTGVSTLSAIWQRPGPDGRPAAVASSPLIVPILAILAVAFLVVVGLAYGTAIRA